MFFCLPELSFANSLLLTHISFAGLYAFNSNMNTCFCFGCSFWHLLFLQISEWFMLFILINVFVQPWTSPEGHSEKSLSCRWLTTISCNPLLHFLLYFALRTCYSNIPKYLLSSLFLSALPSPPYPQKSENYIRSMMSVLLPGE